MPLCLSPRYKGRRLESHAPHVPNQPSEAAAHFYFELAKTVLIKAGGNSSTSIFTHPSSSGGHQGPHRNLHLCAFEIGLYALGLHNFVSPNWLSRTYSSHVSWITGYSRTSSGSLLLGRKGWGTSLFPNVMMMMCYGSCVSCWHSWQHKLSTSDLHTQCFASVLRATDLSQKVFGKGGTQTGFNLSFGGLPKRKIFVKFECALWLCSAFHFPPPCLYPDLLPAFYPHGFQSLKNTPLKIHVFLT